MQDKFNVSIQGRKVDGIFRFEANDWPDETSPITTREALEGYRDCLIETAKNMEAILKSDVPERTDHLMIDSPYFQVNELVLTAPDISPENVNNSIHTYLDSMLKPNKTEEKDEA